ncbi:hypothetical protein [Actinocorallia longicatena]|uniref:DUF7927 domain-containing protein n=1 Tax=Actinocorallia longicatena TaxID=111803 RepID=A0ABP6QF66_9ACTN
MGRELLRGRGRLAAVAGSAVLILLPGSVALPAAAEPSAPFAAFQYGTNGCIEVGVRAGQPKPNVVPDGYDVLSGYPSFGYDTGGYTMTSGTNSCRYNFYDKNPRTDPSAVVIGSGYCLQWAAGQLSGTGYDPEPGDGTVRNAGYVQRILRDYWPAQPAPEVPGTTAKLINAQRSGTVAMAVHYFTDGIVMPPDYQTPALYAAVKSIVDQVLAAGPLPAPADPTPEITGPNGGRTGDLVGPYTIGGNASGPVTLTVEGADAFTDAAGTVPFASGSALPAGGQVWLRSATARQVSLQVSGPVVAGLGTLMVGDPAARVQSMALTEPITLTGKAAKRVSIDPLDPPRMTSQVAAPLIEAGHTTSDTVRIAGLTGPGTLTSTLYGPVAPGGAGCAGADWADVPALPVTRAFDPVGVSGDSDVTTEPVLLDRIGCYSYGTVLAVPSADPVTIPPGTAAETLRVVPQPVPPPFTVTTRASRRVVTAGEAVTDSVTVKGLIPGRTMRIVSTLYGPVAPDGDGRCADVDWTATGLPVAARFPTATLTTGTTITTPPTRLREAGCYSYDAVVTHDQLTGGQVPVGHGRGLPVETIQADAPLKIAKGLTPAHPRFGGSARYTLKITNPGPTRSSAKVTDDLTGVLDDGRYRGDLHASSGTVGYRKPTLTWSGTVPPRESVTITYSLRLDRRGGDRILRNKVTGPATSNCRPGGHDPGCGRPVRILPRRDCRSTAARCRPGPWGEGAMLSDGGQTSREW